MGNVYMEADEVRFKNKKYHNVQTALTAALQGGGGGGTTDYTDLDNKPQINSVTLSGNKSASDLGIVATTDLATDQAAGIVQVDGSTITASNGVISAELPGLATTSTAGIVQPDGTSIVINDGVITALGGSGTTDYSVLTNKPQINNVTLSGNKSLSDLGIAAAADIPGTATTSTAGIVQPDGTTITINNGVISAAGGSGTTDYTDLTNKPQINSVTLSGNKSLSDLGIAAAADIPGTATTSAAGIVQPDGTTITINNGVISAAGGGGGSITPFEDLVFDATNSVAGDGVKTNGQMLNALYSLIDKTKLTHCSKIVIFNTSGKTPVAFISILSWMSSFIKFFGPTSYNGSTAATLSALWLENGNSSWSNFSFSGSNPPAYESMTSNIFNSTNTIGIIY